MGGPSDSSGRVEILLGGEWTSICVHRPEWIHNYARIICHHLGYNGTSVGFFAKDVYGMGSGTIYLQDYICSSSQDLTFLDCGNNGYSCGHKTDVAVACFEGK